MKDVGGDPAPQQLHRRFLAIGRVDTRAAELEDFPTIGDKPRDVVLRSRIEPAQPGRSLPPDQTISADDDLGSGTSTVIEHEQVITVLVEPIEITTATGGFELRPRTEAFVKYSITQRLRGIDVSLAFGKPNLQRAGGDVDDALRARPDRGLDRQIAGVELATVDHAARPGRMETLVRAPPEGAAATAQWQPLFDPRGRIITRQTPVWRRAVQHRVRADDRRDRSQADRRPPAEAFRCPRCGTRSLGRTAGRSDDRGVRSAFLHSASGRRQNHAWPGCSPP